MCGRNSESKCQCHFLIGYIVVLMERPRHLHIYSRCANDRQRSSYRCRYLFSNGYNTRLRLYSSEQHSGNSK